MRGFQILSYQNMFIYLRDKEPEKDGQANASSKACSGLRAGAGSQGLHPGLPWNYQGPSNPGRPSQGMDMQEAEVRGWHQDLNLGTLTPHIHP